MWPKIKWTLNRILPIGFGVIFLVTAYVQMSFADSIKTVDQIEQPYPIAMVLGASLQPDGTPSDALLDRIKVGVSLYKEGKVQKILMTGDNGKFRSDEVDVMKKTAMDQGVPEADIMVDGQGYRTYESCKRAKTVLNITKAIIVTQRFHLGRALYLCNDLGVESIGVTADLQPYRSIVWFWLRDLLASDKAWFDINIHTPNPPV